MNGPTHTVVGSAVAVAVAGSIDVHPLAAGVVGAVVGTLPDRLEFGLVAHRGPTHSWLALVAVGLLPIPLAWRSIIAAAYTSHIVADMLTVSGVRVLWPGRWRLRVLPRSLGVTNGGAVELAVYAVAIAYLLWGLSPQFEALHVLDYIKEF